MNISERLPTPAPEAVVDYGHGEFRVIKPGGFVRCAGEGENAHSFMATTGSRRDASRAGK